MLTLPELEACFIGAKLPHLGLRLGFLPPSPRCPRPPGFKRTRMHNSVVADVEFVAREDRYER